MTKKRPPLHPDAPLHFSDHPRPVTRRQFIRQGLLSGGAMVTGPALLSLFMHPEEAQALISDDPTLTGPAGADCTLAGGPSAMVPFICFDLAGGANLAASNVLVGQKSNVDGQMAFLNATGYSRMGLPANRLPDSTLTFVDSTLGLKFHSQSALLAGIKSKFTNPNSGFIDGAVIPARSDNDTGNNPHNPLYGIAAMGMTGQVSTLIGSQNSDSGGNSLAPTLFMNPSARPTKVSQPSDVTGLVDTGNLTAVMSQADAVSVMETAARISIDKTSSIKPYPNSVTDFAAKNKALQEMVNCGYVKAASIAETFGDITQINPSTDQFIVGGTNSIFTTAEYNGDAEFRKTASVMKMVVSNFAGAGCITMGGYDYHTGDRTTGDARDLRAGKCIGACLQYAALKGSKLMIYVYSDGSVFSDGSLDMNAVTNGGVTVPGGKGVWTGDSSTTACSFFLVYDPLTKSTKITPAKGAADQSHHQIGGFTAAGAVDTSSTPGAGNVNQLVQMVWLNYMALNTGLKNADNSPMTFDSFMANAGGHGLGDATSQDSLTAFKAAV